MLRYVDLNELQIGMVLAEPVYNREGSLELLSEGSRLTRRFIELIQRTNVESIKIYDEEDAMGSDYTMPDSAIIHADIAEKSARDNGADFDVEKFQLELEEINQHDLYEAVRNVCNVNMEVSVITGEGDIPFDKKHKVFINEIEDTFNKITEGKDIDLRALETGIREALPDMIRNNDVLMRLDQLEKSDDYTFQHSMRVSILATMIGKWMGYDSDQLVELAQAGLMFDIGKLKIPKFILEKKGRVSQDEFEVIKRHVQFGYSILLKTEGATANIKYCALQHHERIDGTGYPLRLRARQIHEFAKIIMVCDIFDAMTNDKPYKNKVSPFEAAEYIMWQSGITLDGKVCYILISNLAEYFMGKEVLLSTGETGKVVYIDVNFPTKPSVKIKNGDDTRIVDLIKEKDIHVVDIVKY